MRGSSVQVTKHPCPLGEAAPGQPMRREHLQPSFLDCWFIAAAFVSLARHTRARRRESTALQQSRFQSLCAAPSPCLHPPQKLEGRPRRSPSCSASAPSGESPARAQEKPLTQAARTSSSPAKTSLRTGCCSHAAPAPSPKRRPRPASCAMTFRRQSEPRPV
jgi:hypothetical protein